jgi:CHASE3 domain sensor protein
MNISAYWLRRKVALGLAVVLAVPLGGSATVFAQQATPNQQQTGVSSSQPLSHNSDANAAGTSQTSNGQSDNSSASQEQKGPPAPVGTAVAPYEKGIGVAASRPAGAVIAPAKQRRTRSFVIKVGLLIGAAVAVGTVVALSNASPSKPQQQ